MGIGYFLIFFAEIVFASFLAERLIIGLHEFYWTKRLKEQLVGKHGDGGVVRADWLRELILCKFCQSWWCGWLSIVIIQIAIDDLSWHCIWLGIISGSGSNFIHHLRDGFRNWNRRYTDWEK